MSPFLRSYGLLLTVKHWFVVSRRYHRVECKRNSKYTICIDSLIITTFSSCGVFSQKENSAQCGSKFFLHLPKYKFWSKLIIIKIVFQHILHIVGYFVFRYIIVDESMISLTSWEITHYLRISKICLNSGENSPQKLSPAEFLVQNFQKIVWSSQTLIFLRLLCQITKIHLIWIWWMIWQIIHHVLLPRHTALTF